MRSRARRRTTTNHRLKRHSQFLWRKALNTISIHQFIKYPRASSVANQLPGCSSCAPLTTHVCNVLLLLSLAVLPP